MKKNIIRIISSTHVDRHGDVMTKEVLDRALTCINGTSKVRLGLEHLRTIPPFGIITNGSVVKGEDEHYYLLGEQAIFDKKEVCLLNDGTKLIKESFSNLEFHFTECKCEEVNKISVTTDLINFTSKEELNEVFSLVKQESNLDFSTDYLIRKSEIPDAEFIITITTNIAIGIGLLKSNILEGLKAAINQDIAKFYIFITRLIIELFKRAYPANRPKNFVISYPNPDYIIELVITTNNANDVLESIVREKLSVISEKIALLSNLNPDKIQFIYKNNAWDFNYLLTKEGAVIGKEKAFKARNEVLKEILHKKNVENE